VSGCNAGVGVYVRALPELASVARNSRRDGIRPRHLHVPTRRRRGGAKLLRRLRTQFLDRRLLGGGRAHPALGVEYAQSVSRAPGRGLRNLGRLQPRRGGKGSLPPAAPPLTP